MSLLIPVVVAFAEDIAPTGPEAAVVENTAPEADQAIVAPALPVAPETPEAVAPNADLPQAAVPADALAAENLEFISGEITAVDQEAKSVTVKLYGETDNKAENKTISVKVDEATDVTDGEKDRDLKSLAAGTEVDVEYDPASNKATYIFVY